VEPDAEGYTALHWAASFAAGAAGRRIALLCDACNELAGAAAGADAGPEGADIAAALTSFLNSPCRLQSETALHRACRFGRAGAVAELVRRGADCRVQNAARLAPWDVAGCGERSACVSASAVPGGSHHAAAVTAGGLSGVSGVGLGFVPPSLVDPAMRRAAVRALAEAAPSLQCLVLHHDDCLAHVTRTGDREHQEAPERIVAILDKIRTPPPPAAAATAPGAGAGIGASAFDPLELRISSDVPRASRDQVLRVHSREYVHLVYALDHYVRQHQIGVPFTPHVQRALSHHKHHPHRKPPATQPKAAAKAADSEPRGEEGIGAGMQRSNSAFALFPSVAPSPVSVAPSLHLAFPWQSGPLPSSDEGPGHAFPLAPASEGAAVGEGQGSQEDLALLQGGTSDTTFSAGSLPAALRAAGSVCHAIDEVLRGACRNAFCLVRPPGHHAGVNGLLKDFPSSQSCGFCIFNSVAIGALHALDRWPGRARRVAIVDIDVHHGNGTEEIIRRWADAHKGGDDKGLFFFSIHLFDMEQAGQQQQDAAEEAVQKQGTDTTNGAAAVAPQVAEKRQTRFKGTKQPPLVRGDSPEASFPASRKAVGSDGQLLDGVAPAPVARTKRGARTSKGSAAGADAPELSESGALGAEAMKASPPQGRSRRKAVETQLSPPPDQPSSLDDSMPVTVQPNADETAATMVTDSMESNSTPTLASGESKRRARIKLTVSNRGTSPGGASTLSADGETATNNRYASAGQDEAEHVQLAKRSRLADAEATQGRWDMMSPESKPAPLAFASGAATHMNAPKSILKTNPGPSPVADALTDSEEPIQQQPGLAASRSVSFASFEDATKAPSTAKPSLRILPRQSDKSFGSEIALRPFDASALAPELDPSLFITEAGISLTPRKFSGLNSLGVPFDDTKSEAYGLRTHTHAHPQTGQRVIPPSASLRPAFSLFVDGAPPALETLSASVPLAMQPSLDSPKAGFELELEEKREKDGGILTHPRPSPRTEMPPVLFPDVKSQESSLFSSVFPTNVVVASSCGGESGGEHAHSGNISAKLLVTGDSSSTHVNSVITSLDTAAAGAADSLEAAMLRSRARESGDAASASAPANALDNVSYCFYPGTGAADVLEANCMNAPVPPLWKERREHKADNKTLKKARHGRLAVLRLIREKLVPALRAFGPDLILISAGFDAGKDDFGNTKTNERGVLMEGMNLSPSDFRTITSEILRVSRVCCPGRVVSVLEGGYGRWVWGSPSPTSTASNSFGNGDGMGPMGAAPAASPTLSEASNTSTIKGYLKRDSLAENCAAHLRALVDDGLFSSIPLSQHANGFVAHNGAE
jgi:acetoin utilization deacetylase AcuC-like enzyme